MCAPFLVFAIFESGIGRDIAKKTITFLCDPCFLGSGNSSTTQTNFHMNPDTLYNQPSNPLLVNNHLASHVYCVIAIAGMCANPDTYPNIFYGTVDDGNYGCNTYPFCYPVFGCGTTCSNITTG